MNIKFLKSFIFYIVGLSLEKTSSQQLCVLCKGALENRNDSIFPHCSFCKCQRCAGCGGVVSMSFTRVDPSNFLKWIVPEKILDKIYANLSVKYRCDSCNKIPYKSLNIVTVISRLWSL